MNKRYGVWNSLKKEFQFNNVICSSPEEVNKIMIKKIGHDWKKWRFEVVDIDKQLQKLENNKTGLKNVLNFGKYKGIAVKDIPIDYLRWVNDKGILKFKDEVLKFIGVI